ncbi:hypothetical protein KCP73_04745 [Salmonella enterica subsp. enterica]|nr:hypothetical protein KCP73_04745 [Salmonella enterica subsp. enterica]
MFDNAGLLSLSPASRRGDFAVVILARFFQYFGSGCRRSLSLSGARFLVKIGISPQAITRILRKGVGRTIFKRQHCRPYAPQGGRGTSRNAGRRAHLNGCLLVASGAAGGCGTVANAAWR